jgi:hypothetical protein
MRADAPREGGRDTAMLNVELRVADLGFGVVDRSLSGSLIGRALVDVLRRNYVVTLQHLSASEFPIREHQPRGRVLKLCVRLGEPNLVRSRVDREEKIAFVDDISILEMVSP